ncbi:1,2-dihydroxy-3-keto-5-methylthiopentene dioxygenase [Elysia marginata]|uniref:acireductone dioxygenase (Fe(2+)-requiring) n=1 Tax=Elysia marginata TaxID=1093978 RepID=A0AAV4HSC0_9GAST|nr:1,2-dihydroxy-3-keto-5-methylthiopentene dioxygenase [Elysia marginata]
MQVFTSEHLHPDVEVRFISAGSGYFDMRSRDDRWIRLELSEGDLLVIPGGAYHRFSLDKKAYIKVRRWFSEEESWVAFNRPDGDTHSARQRYIQQHHNDLLEVNED